MTLTISILGNFLLVQIDCPLIQFTPFKFLAQKLELIENKKHKLGKTRKYSSKNFIKGLPDNKLRFIPAIYPP